MQASVQSNVIQLQYDEVIAPHYDIDPQSVLGDSLDRAIGQIRRHERLGGLDIPTSVLDLGVGTGMFLKKLRADSERRIQPHGLDISQKMIDIARSRIPDLIPAIDDAKNLEDHFQEQSFDLVGTHFITGFVGIDVLAPKIFNKLAKGGYWSFVGGTKAGFPTLQKKAFSAPYKWFFGGKSLDVDKFVCNPTDQIEVVRTLEQNGFAVRECETFLPDLSFKNMNEFMDFAYWGGWLTPFVEKLGLHQAPPFMRALLNALFFPVKDHHSIVIALAQKI